MTCRLFVDEVGNGDLRGSAGDDNVRYLSLTGVLTKRSTHDSKIVPAFDAMKRDLFGQTNVIFHRREIIRREGQFTALRDPTLRADFDRKLLGIMRDCPYLAITVTIDKRAHLEKYSTWHFDPYHYCLLCLVERYTLWLRRNDCKGDVAVEPRFPKADKRLKRSFQRIYQEGTGRIRAKTVQQHLLSHDIKFFGKSHNVAGMQLCDLLAHPSYRSMKFERLGLDEPADFGTAVVRILREQRYARHPKSKVIEGWGRKWLP